MTAVRHSPAAFPADRGEVEGWFRSRGLSARWWTNGPGDTYGWHDHPYRKVLACHRGGIVFHTREGDVSLGPGDRLDIDPGTEHAATVGPEGVTCVEAASSA